jgi:MoxR-like ATPase
MSVKPKITELLKRLNDGVIEKEDVIALSLLSSVAGESIFLLGAPGVAKSLIARRLKYAYKEGSSFEYLMNRFSTPDEIFGPVSISQLKDHDKYERIVKNYLPASTVVFLDEIWKAGPSIQNALLTVLNEKIYRNGEQEIIVPMKALISASNELPSKGEGLEALWDRFLVRLIVEGVNDKQNFNDMISKPLKSYSDTVVEILKITDEEYKIWDNLIDEIEIPENVFNVINVIRNYIEQHNQREENKDRIIYISDRRWRKIVRLLRTSAFLNDRKTVDLMDCFLIQHCIWNEVEQIPAANQFVKDAIQKHGYNLSLNISSISDELKDFWKEVLGETSHMKKVEFPKIYDNNFYLIEGFNPPFIKISDYNQLGDDYANVTFYENSSNGWHRINYSTNYKIKLSNKPNNIVHDGQLRKIETTESEKPATKRPHPAVKLDWDKRVKVFLTTTSNLKSRIDSFKNNDLKHIRINLFVNSSYAEIVEDNLIRLQNKIEKLDIEVSRIQHYYENVEQGVFIDYPLLSLSNGQNDFDLSELTDGFDEWIFEQLQNHEISNSSDFLSKDIDFFLDNTDIDEDLYDEIKETIENRLNDGQ